MEVCLLKTIVTAVKFYENYLFSGCGGSLSVYEFSNKEWSFKVNLNILLAQNIHGIVIKCLRRILVFGSKFLAIVSFDSECNDLTIINKYYCEDWIMDGKWLSESEFCLLTAHSKLMLYSVDQDTHKSSVTCTNRCINYCGTIINDMWDDLIVLSGTVYNHIIIWSTPGTVLHELKGHKGVIFSLTCNVDLALIVSTSDDRSAFVWQIFWDSSTSAETEIESLNHKGHEAWRTAKIVPALSVWGHTARVWASVIIDSDHFATVGEDGMAIVWDRKDGKVCWSTKSSGGGAVSLSCRPGELAVGGSDSSLAVHNWVASSSLITPSSLPPVRAAPRRVVFNAQGEVVVCCNDGSIQQWNGSSWTELYCNDDLSSYCIASPNPSRTFLALASISGSVHLLRFNNKSPFCKKLIKERIYSLLWLKELTFLICGEDGLLSIWEIQESEDAVDLIMSKELVLPQSKERWPTCADLQINSLLVGDRQGSIIFYNLADSSKECGGLIRGVHKGRGASYIKWNGPYTAISCGRDGTVRKFRCIKELSLESTLRLQVDWPAGIISNQLMGPLLLAFHHVYAEIIALDTMRTVLRVKCGGGHRSWDWYVTADGTSVNIAFVSNKIVHVASSVLTRPAYLLQGYHGRTINCACVVRDRRDVTFISGGEDCTVRMLSFSGDCFSTGTHLSNVRDVICHQRTESHKLIFSAGGRQQIKSWFFNKDGLLSEAGCSREEKEDYSGEAMDFGETRYMALCTESDDSNSHITVYVASSDGTMRIYDYFKEGRHFVFRSKSSMEVDKCLLCIAKCNQFIFTGSTSGTISVLNNQELIEKVTAHSGGVNVISVNFVDSLFIVATGGDDTSIVVSHFNFMGKFLSSVILKYHSAQVTGLAILRGEWLFSVGCDQVLVVWKLKISNSTEYAITKTYRSPIADPHGLIVSSSLEEEEDLVVIFGIGIEVLKLNLSKLSCT